MLRRSFTLSTLGFTVAAAYAPPGFATVAVPPPGSSAGIGSVPNLRDIGGYQTQSGAFVRRNIAFRSEHLSPIAPQDKAKLAALNLTRVYDLRTAPERLAQPDALPPGTPVTVLDVMRDEEGMATKLNGLLADPKAANATLGNGKMLLVVGDVYRDFVRLPSARIAYGGLYRGLAAPDYAPAQLYHCTAGKDRTGWATASLLTFLGVPKSQVYADYLKTNDYYLADNKPAIEKFSQHGGDPRIMTALLAARPEYLDAAFQQVERDHGSIDGYLSEGLGLSQNEQAQLKKNFLVS